jgi:hypothetical protein
MRALQLPASRTAQLSTAQLEAFVASCRGIAAGFAAGPDRCEAFLSEQGDVLIMELLGSSNPTVRARSISRQECSSALWSSLPSYGAP